MPSSRRAGDPLLRWRKNFPILSRSTYLISNSLGAMPRSVYGRMEEYAEMWATRGVRAWGESWWELQGKVGDTIAPLIGASAGEISMHTNISLLQSILISCFDFRGKRNEIVLSDMEFPSVLYVYQSFARSLGAKLRIVRSPDGVTIPTETLVKAINEKTMLLPMSHVLFKSAYVQDVKTITHAAHRVGAKVILDAYHAVGIIPVNVRSLGVDILVGGVLKWLCGGPGGAFLWMRPSLRRKLSPKITGWMAHRHPFAFDTQMSLRDDAQKFLNGTPSVPALYAAQEGPTIIARAGIENIRGKSIRQTSQTLAKAHELGIGITSPENAACRGGTVTLTPPHAYQVSRELLRRNIVVDYREGAGIRIAPHFYNSDAEVETVMGEIRDILATKAYRRHPQRRSRVT